MLKNIKQLYTNCNFTFIATSVVIIFITLSLVGCSKEDAKITPEKEDIIEVSQGKVWGVNAIATRAGQDSETKSLNINASNDASLSVEDGWDGEETKLLYTTNFDKNLHFMWDDYQKIEVYRDNTKVGELTVRAGGDNDAELSGSLTGSFNVGDELTLYTSIFW